MTYDEAVAEINVRYKGGERDIEVSPDVYAAYVGGLLAIEREGGSHNLLNDWVVFKLAKVRKAAPAPTPELSNAGVRCPTCQHEMQVGDWPFCPHGRGIYGVQDDSIPGGLEIKNGLCNEDGSPRKYYSRTEINAEAKRRGLENHVVHKGSKGSDKSKHTVRWV